MHLSILLWIYSIRIKFNIFLAYFRCGRPSHHRHRHSHCQINSKPSRNTFTILDGKKQKQPMCNPLENYSLSKSGEKNELIGYSVEMDSKQIISPLKKKRSSILIWSLMHSDETAKCKPPVRLLICLAVYCYIYLRYAIRKSCISLFSFIFF